MLASVLERKIWEIYEKFLDIGGEKTWTLYNIFEAKIFSLMKLNSLVFFLVPNYKYYFPKKISIL